MWRRVSVPALLIVLGTTVGAYSALQPPTPGSAGVGDDYFPLLGNGGYDVGHYSLAFSYDPATRVLDGTATVTATATQNLSRFDLDLRGFDIDRLTVNGAAAAFNAALAQAGRGPSSTAFSAKGKTSVEGTPAEAQAAAEAGVADAGSEG